MSFKNRKDKPKHNKKIILSLYILNRVTQIIQALISTMCTNTANKNVYFIIGTL